MKYLFALFVSMVLFSCVDNQVADNNAVATPESAAIPEGAIQEPYQDNSAMVKVTIKNEAGNVVEQGDLLNGHKVGNWTAFYTNGVVKSVTGYVDGVMQGMHIEMGQRGEIEKRCYYHNGQLHGDYVVYNRNRIKEEKTYENGLLQGVAKSYYDNGTLMEESPYSDGKRDGLSRWYDQEGNVSIEYEYDNGELVEK
ncbi:hypothetical protein LVD15_06495 [Fulvivirga maritima]|uniref:toxin-antitoxin system YwqK family antitoxin n=1 Tax=Fulvivirga maritima TaxID=2904247 RepID=UPI001F17B363|nr:hypothetical protein [Fulvivirga maritima]UII28071.1 hypothetical protein LVD15_06495 [Fulvivirga maritima]